MQQLNLFSETYREKITLDLFRAYFDARKNKRNTINQLVFEKHLEPNIFALANEVLQYNYEPKSSICFMVNEPVKREIFAADFRDRVVHHFIYNYIAPVFEKTFINDSYSCRVGKGTHYGIKRIDHFIRSCSCNYTHDCYILKLDIKGYFMAMNKILLFQKVKQELIKRKNKLNFDLPLVLYLIEKTIFNDPTKNCIIKGQKTDWHNLPKDKSLFHAKKNCGLPIGNLTSQLFGNVYLNEFDHWVKKELGIKHYGRYVDDFVLIHENKDYLKSLIPVLTNFLLSTLKLNLHPRKIYLQHYTKGVIYLGAMIKPYRIYIGNRTKGNFYSTIQHYNQIIDQRTPDKDDIQAFQSSMNSYLGIAKHYKTRNLRKKLIFEHMDNRWWQYFYLLNYDKFVLKPKSRKTVNYVG